MIIGTEIISFASKLLNLWERLSLLVRQTGTLFDGMNLYKIYYNAFGDNGNADNKVLPYGGESQDHNEVEVNEA